jgi:hypothetical protein
VAAVGFIAPDILSLRASALVGLLCQAQRLRRRWPLAQAARRSGGNGPRCPWRVRSAFLQPAAPAAITTTHQRPPLSQRGANVKDRPLSPRSPRNDRAEGLVRTSCCRAPEIAGERVASTTLYLFHAKLNQATIEALGRIRTADDPGLGDRLIDWAKCNDYAMSDARRDLGIDESKKRNHERPSLSRILQPTSGEASQT